MALLDDDRFEASASYRALARVKEMEVELRELAERSCPACGRAFSSDAEPLAKFYAHLRTRYCVGGRRWFLWMRVCRETRPHLHQACLRCGARWVAAPKVPMGYT